MLFCPSALQSQVLSCAVGCSLPLAGAPDSGTDLLCHGIEVFDQLCSDIGAAEEEGVMRACRGAIGVKDGNGTQDNMAVYENCVASNICGHVTGAWGSCLQCIIAACLELKNSPDCLWIASARCGCFSAAI